MNWRKGYHKKIWISCLIYLHRQSSATRLTHVSSVSCYIVARDLGIEKGGESQLVEIDEVMMDDAVTWNNAAHL